MTIDGYVRLLLHFLPRAWGSAAPNAGVQGEEMKESSRQKNNLSFLPLGEISYMAELQISPGS